MPLAQLTYGSSIRRFRAAASFRLQLSRSVARVTASSASAMGDAILQR
jgi:hypothetical protein